MTQRILEQLSSISVIIAALVVTGSTLSHWRETKIHPKEMIRDQLEGHELPLKGVKWNNYRATVVLALNTGCHFCTASAPFYRQLASLRYNRANINIIAVFPQTQAVAEHYLNDKNIAVSAILSEPLENIMVEGTPTMYLVGPDGKVKHSWIGYLDENRQRSVLASLEAFANS